SSPSKPASRSSTACSSRARAPPEATRRCCSATPTWSPTPSATEPRRPAFYPRERLGGRLREQGNDPSPTVRTSPLDRARAAVHGAVRGRPRRRYRQRRAPLDWRRARLLAGEPVVGGQRLRAHL